MVGWAGGTLPAIAPAEDVVLRVPSGTDARGCVTVAADDAEPLVRGGWQRIEQPQPV
jgi:hypothetical protein